MARRHRLPQTLSRDEQTAILAQTKNTRNQLLLRMMLIAGLRSSEATGLLVEQVDLKNRQINVIGKGNYERIVWVTSPLARDIKRYLRVKPVSPYLFPSRTGSRITTQYLRALVPHLAKRAGITRRVHPHMLRHTFATELYARTKDILLVQRALGHADIGTTEIYTHVADGDLQAAMQRRSRPA